MKLFDIPGYEGKYKISESGDIISVGRFVPESGRAGRYYPERILKQQPDKDGYLGVRLCSEGTYKNFKVHRLVAMVFIPNREELPCVNHKDENKSNNHVDNLEWCTVAYNNNYNDRQVKIANSKKKAIGMYTLDNQLVKIFTSIKEIDTTTKYCKRYIIECCKGRRLKYNNYKWKYEII